MTPQVAPFTVTQLIVSFLFIFALVWVEIQTRIPPPKSATWAVPTLFLALALGWRWRQEGAGGGRGRRGQGVRGRRRRLQGAAGGGLVGRGRGRRGGDHQLSVQGGREGGGRGCVPSHWEPGGGRELPLALPRLVAEQQGGRGLAVGGLALYKRVFSFRHGAGLRVHGVWPF